jgi:hypothetical protein
VGRGGDEDWWEKMKIEKEKLGYGGDNKICLNMGYALEGERKNWLG